MIDVFIVLGLQPTITAIVLTPAEMAINLQDKMSINVIEEQDVPPPTKKARIAKFIHRKAELAQPEMVEHIAGQVFKTSSKNKRLDG